MARGPCKKCGVNHFLGNPCPEKEQAPLALRRNLAPEGFEYSKGWGVNTKGVPVTWTLPQRSRMGSLTFPEENNG